MLALVSASWGVNAQDADTLSAASVFGVKVRPVVPAAEQVYLPLQSAAPQQMAAVLQHFTGVQVKDYGGAGGLKTVNIRSLGSEHVGIFLDGIQVDNAQNMQVDLSRFSTDGIGTVALYNGQKSRRLQTAKEYASGAAVHLTSDPPLHFDGSGGHFRLRGGSFGTFNPSVLWDNILGKGVALRTQAEFLTSNGRYKYPCYDTTLVRENGDIKSLRLEMQLFGTPRNGNWMLHAYSYGSERGFPGPVIRRAAGFPFSAERQADQDIFIQGGWSQDWTDRYSTSVKFKYANTYTHYDTHPEKNPMAMPYDVHYRQQSGYLSLAHSYIPAGSWSVDLSCDIQHNSLASDAGYFVTPRRTSFTGVLAARFAREKFRAAAHLAYTGAWDRFKNPDAGGWSRRNTYRDSWIPSVSLFYKPLEWLEADAYAKRSYRLPSFNDLYYTRIGNSSLAPESALQFGADIRASFKGWEIRISPYYNRITDKIVALPTSSQFRWTMLNIGTVDITGLDAKAGGDLDVGSVRVSAVGRYTFQLALDHSDPDGLTYGNQIPYIPRHSGAVELETRWKVLCFSWSSTFTGTRWSRTANIPDYCIKPWTVSDASVSLRLKKLGAGVVIGNIFNRQYQIVQGYPMPGTSVMLSLEYTW